MFSTGEGRRGMRSGHAGQKNEERNSKNNMLTEEEKNAGLEGKIIPINIESR